MIEESSPDFLDNPRGAGKSDPKQINIAKFDMLDGVISKFMQCRDIIRDFEKVPQVSTLLKSLPHYDLDSMLKF